MNPTADIVLIMVSAYPCQLLCSQDQLCAPDGPLPYANPVETAVDGIHPGLPLHHQHCLDVVLLSWGAPEAHIWRPS